MEGRVVVLILGEATLLYNRRLQRRAVWKALEAVVAMEMYVATVILGSRAYEMLAGLRVCRRLRAWSFVMSPSAAISQLRIVNTECLRDQCLMLV